jgi:uncharacterized protein (TIGR00251 family)
MHEPDCLRIKIKVIPGATRTGIEWLGDKLKIKVNAPPEKGRANAAVTLMLAERLGLPHSAVTIVAGHGNPLKTVEIKGISLAGLKRIMADQRV